METNELEFDEDKDIALSNRATDQAHDLNDSLGELIHLLEEDGCRMDPDVLGVFEKRVSDLASTLKEIKDIQARLPKEEG
jgi:hypothetical protein